MRRSVAVIGTADSLKQIHSNNSADESPLIQINDVRFGSQGDIPDVGSCVCFVPESGRPKVMSTTQEVTRLIRGRNLI